MISAFWRTAAAAAALAIASAAGQPARGQDPAAPAPAQAQAPAANPAAAPAAEAPAPAPAPDGQPAAPAQTPVPFKFVDPRPPETVVARTTKGEITIERLKKFYENYRVPVAPIVEAERLPQMPAAWIDQVARSLAMAERIQEKVLTLADPAERAVYDAALDQYLLNYSIEEVYKRRVTDRIGEPTDAEVQGYYDSHRPEFAQPFQFKMRHLFLMTYERYQAQQGDTLEGIAEKIAGSASKVAEIRSDVAARPPRWVPPEEREKKLMKPLEPGEKLLVPMSEEKAQLVKAKLEEILAQQKGGKDFAALSDEFSQGESRGQIVGPLPSGVRPMVPELLDAARKTPAGAVSEIFRTKHGFNAIEVVEKIEEGQKPVESVRDEIAKLIKDERKKKLEKEYSDELLKLRPIEINYDLFARAPNLAEDAPLVKIEKKEFTWTMFKATWEKDLGPGASKEAIELAVRQFQPILWEMTLVWARDNKLFEEPAMSEKVGALRMSVYASAYLDRAAEARMKAEITDAKKAEIYEQTKTTDFMRPAMLTYEIIRRAPGPVPPENLPQELERVAAQLTQELANIQGPDDFANLAMTTNPDKRREAYQDVPVTSLRGKMAEELKNLAAGRVSAPIIEGNEVFAVFVSQIKPAEPKPYDEALPEIEARLRQMLRNQISIETVNETVGELQYQFLLDPNA